MVRCGIFGDDNRFHRATFSTEQPSYIGVISDFYSKTLWTILIRRSLSIRRFQLLLQSFVRPMVVSPSTRATFATTSSPPTSSPTRLYLGSASWHTTSPKRRFPSLIKVVMWRATNQVVAFIITDYQWFKHHPQWLIKKIPKIISGFCLLVYSYTRRTRLIAISRVRREQRPTDGPTDGPTDQQSGL